VGPLNPSDVGKVGLGSALELNLQSAPQQPSHWPASAGAQKATAICAPHGLRFDPSSASGCVICRRSSLPAQSSASPARWFLAATAVVVLLTCAAYLLR
jgi:hypothetical protein